MVACLSIIALMAFSYPSAALQDPYPLDLLDPLDHDVVLETLYELNHNGTENVSGRLLVDSLPPYHAGEALTLTLLWNASHEGNVTPEAWLGLDELVGPADWTLVAIHAGATQLGDYGQDGYVDYRRSSMEVVPSVSSVAMLGRVTWGNESVNVSFPISPLPPRTILSVGVDTLDGNISVPERAWVDVPLLLGNAGGAPALDMVIDLRYGGRIVHTLEVPLVAPGGNASLEVPLHPVHGEEVLGVYLVSGPDAPRWLANLTVRVSPRTVLQVLSVSSTEGEVVSGSRAVVEVVVANAGNFTSTEERIEFLVDGAVSENSTVVGLAPGDTTKVTFRPVLRGPGTHTVSARVEGDELNAVTTKVEVREGAPSAGTVAALAAQLLVAFLIRAGWRSSRAGRA